MRLIRLNRRESVTASSQHYVVLRRLAPGLGVILLLAAVGAVSAAKPPKPPAGLSAEAWVTPTVQYLNDTAGTVFTFSIRNTGTIGIGAVEVVRPSTSWLVTSCPLAPTGWSSQRSDNFCRYRSEETSADDLQPGTLTSAFEVLATTAAGTADRTGAWIIRVSASDSFDTPSSLKPAPAVPPGLTITAFSFQITDAVVASGNAGDPCPAATVDNHSAITGSTQTILICGRNRMTVADTPTAARSTLGGSFIADDGTFSSALIPANSAVMVIGTWTGAEITSTPGAGQTIIATIGSAANRNSPITTLDDVCGPSPAFEICLANGGYEALNQPPDAVDDTADADEDGPAGAIDVLANDSDPDGDPFSITATGGNPLGQVTITGGGSGIDYDPDGQFESLAAGETATDTFSYTIADTFGATDTATVTVTISGQNDGPDAVDDSDDADEDGPAIIIDVLGNDTDPDATDVLSVASVDTTGTAGTVTNNGTDVTYDPNGQFESLAAGETATDTFTYMVSDGQGGTDTATVTVTVHGQNDDPVANDDADDADEDGPAITINVLANDTDADASDVLTVDSIDTTGTFGGVTNNGTHVTYDPDGQFESLAAGETAIDTFTYTVSDGNGGTDTAVVTVTVHGQNDGPDAVDDVAGADEDGPAIIIDVLANDTDDDGDTLTVDSVDTTGTLGSVTNNGTDVTYDPNGQFEWLAAGDTDTDTFTYTVSDGHGGTDTATVTVVITGQNDAPTATDDADDADEDGPAIAIDVLANDTDPDATDVLVVTGFDDSGTVGAVTDNGDGTFDYDPNGQFESLAAGETTLDTFTYDISDGNGGTDTATVTVTVHGQNDDPTANDDTDSTTEFADVDIDVLANDTDPDASDVLTVQSVDTTGTTGLVTNNGTDVTYDPNGQFDALEDGETDTDTFTYTVSDGNGGTDTATVTVTIIGSTDVPPTAVDDSTTVAEDSGASAIDVLANDTDPDGGPIAIALASDPANGTVVLTGGSPGEHTGLTYEPDSNYCNDPPGTTTDTFTYTLNGGSTATVSVAVTCVDDPPTAVNDSATVVEDSGASAINVLANDTDVDGGPTTISLASDPANGTVVITGGGSGLTYEPDPNYCNDPPGTTPDTFTYTLNGDSAATVSITVTCVDDAPVADDETFDGANGAIGNTSLVVNDPTDPAPALSSPKKSITGDILDGDVDVDGPGPLEVTPGVFATNDGGSVTIQADGDFVFDPAPATSCTDTSDFFDYTLVDAGSPGSTDVGRVTISIAGCVWYVSNAADGNSGTSLAPFDTLAQGETASGANHTVFVFDGDNTSTGYGGDGYAMNAGERLIGEHEGLVVDPDGGGPLSAVDLFPADPGAHPTLTAINADVISLDDGNEIRGFNVDPSGTGGGIDGAAGDTGGGTIDDVNIVDTGTAGTQPALELNATTGTFNLSNLLITTTSSAGISIASAGTVNFAGTGTIAVTAAGGAGVRIIGTTTSGVIDSVTVTSSPNEGIVLDDNAGALTVNDINLTTTGTGLLVDSSEDVTINGGDADITSGGTAVSLTTVTGNPANPPEVTLDAVTSTGGTVGIFIDDIGAGTFSANSGTLSGHSLAEIDVNAGSGNVAYLGTIGNGTGLSVDVSNRTGGTVSVAGNINDTNDAGGGINLTGNTGGTTTFSGDTKTLNTGALTAVSLTTNPGHTINLNGGGLDIDTTTGVGLTATGGGLLQVTTGANPNTVDTGTGTAVNVNSTSISNAGMTFRSVNSNGGTNGIVLNTTGTGGTNGSFVITGNSAGTCGTAGTIADCSGGTITGKSGDAISLQSTLSPSFTRMNLANNNGSGISATGVSALTVAHSRIDDSGDTAGIFEAGISLTNVTGTSSVSSSTISHSFDSNVHWNISSGTGTVNVASSNIGPTNIDGTLGNSGIQVVGTGTGVGTLNVTGSTFDDNNASGVGTSMANSSALTMNVSTSTFTDNNFAAAVGVVDDADITFDINGNTALRSETNAFQVLSGETSNTGSHVSGFIRNNIIGNANADSGARDLHGIAVELNDDADGVISILNNNIQHVDQHGIFVTTRDLTGTDPTPNDATLDVHIRDNVISSIDDNSIVPIGLVYGMLIDARSASNMCLDINSNDSANIAAADIRVRQRDTSIFRLERFAGNGVLVTDVENFIIAQSDPGTTADATLATSFTGVADGTCRDP